MIPLNKVNRMSRNGKGLSKNEGISLLTGKGLSQRKTGFFVASFCEALRLVKRRRSSE